MAKKLSPIDIGWAAGIIDGEGCLSVYKSGDHKRRIFGVSLVLSISEENVVKKLRGLFGGRIRLAKVKGENCRNVFEWRIAEKPLKELLDLLCPYFVAKRIQAELMIDYLESPWRGRGARLKKDGTFRGRTEEQKQFDHALTTAITVAKPKYWGKDVKFKNNDDLAEWVLTHPRVLNCLGG